MGWMRAAWRFLHWRQLPLHTQPAGNEPHDPRGSLASQRCLGFGLVLIGYEDAVTAISRRSPQPPSHTREASENGRSGPGPGPGSVIEVDLTTADGHSRALTGRAFDRSSPSLPSLRPEPASDWGHVRDVSRLDHSLGKCSECLHQLFEFMTLERFVCGHCRFVRPVLHVGPELEAAIR